jgi:putative tricarboxylic transport membrane protein
MWEMTLSALSEIMGYWWLIPFGVALGIFIGAVPGFSSTNVLIILLPFTLGMESGAGMAFMASVYSGSHMGGSIPAVLFNVPGTGAAAATCFDGYPMTQQGRGQEALAIAFVASAVGGLFTTGITLGALPYLSRLVYYFGSIENFVIILFGVALIGQITGGSAIKGIIAGMFGLLLGAIGYDHVYSVPRATFGLVYLFDGMPRVPAIVGLFAISEAFRMIEKDTIIDASQLSGALKEGWQGTVRGIATSFRKFGAIIRSSLIGFIVGIIPGAGATIGSFVSYQQAMAFSKDKNAFGKGEPEGVIAAEAANNGLTSGSLIPLLTLGIPGGGTAAVMVVVLQAHGVPIGPRLFQVMPQLAYGVVVAMLVAYIVMIFMGIPLAKGLAKMSFVPTKILAPTIISFTLIGSFVARGFLFDMWIALFFGVLGYILKRTGYSPHAVLLGVILGPLAEQYFLRALLLGNGNPAILFSRPLGNFLWALLAVSMVMPSLLARFRNRKAGR